MDTSAARRGRETGHPLPIGPEGRRRAVALLVGGALALLALPALGQTPRERVDMSHEVVVLPAGAELEVRLERPISTESSEKGDPWTAVLTHPLTDGERVLVERGTRVMGVVTAAGPVVIHGETRQVLAVRPMEIEVGIERYPIRAEVIGAEPHGHDEPDEKLTAALRGGMAGTAVAVAPGEAEIELHEGSRMTLRLEETVRVERPSR